MTAKTGGLEFRICQVSVSIVRNTVGDIESVFLLRFCGIDLVI